MAFFHNKKLTNLQAPAKEVCLYGRLVQGENAAFTRQKSLVQIQQRPFFLWLSRIEVPRARECVAFSFAMPPQIYG
jgi:hypothetical protein